MGRRCKCVTCQTCDDATVMPGRGIQNLYNSFALIHFLMLLFPPVEFCVIAGFIMLTPIVTPSFVCVRIKCNRQLPSKSSIHSDQVTNGFVCRKLHNTLEVLHESGFDLYNILL